MSIILIAALALSAQAQPPAQPSAPLPVMEPGTMGERSLTPAHDLFYEDLPRPTTEAREAIHQFGACVARRSPERAADTLRGDPTTHRYRNGLRQLARVNDHCFRVARTRLRSTNILFAGAVAEALLEQDSAPLNVRLMRAPDGSAGSTAPIPERVARCVVRSVPDDTGRLLATEPGSAGEMAAAQALTGAVAACSPRDRQVRTSSAGLRALLAVAAFRTLHRTDKRADAE